MANTINADNGVVSTVPGLKYSADTSGVLVLQTNTTDALTLDTTQGATFSTGALVTNPYAGSYSSGMVLDHTTSLGRISVAASSGIAFYNGGISARVETMRITSTGNVGIGTASPTNFGSNFRLLDVEGTDYGVIQASNSGTSTTIEMMAAPSIGYLGTRSNHPLAFRTFDTERMRIISSGNVGIGTTAPNGLLNIGTNGSATATPLALLAYSAAGLGTALDDMRYVAEFGGATGNNVRLLFALHRTSIADPNWGTAAWRIQSAVDSSFTGPGSNRGYVELAFGNQGSYQGIGLSGSGAIAPDFIVNQSGNVGIGTSSPAQALTVSRADFSFLQLTTTNTATLTCVYGSNSSTQTAILGTGTNHPLAFQTNSTERMRIDSSGNVGINYTAMSSLGAKLYVYGYSGFGASANGSVSLGSRTNWTSTFENNAGSYGLGVNVNASTGIVNIQSQRFDGTATAYDISLNPLGGNVGIGTSSPSSKLNIYDATSSILTVSGDTAANIIVYRASTDASTPSLGLRKARGTIASPTAVATGDNNGVIFFQAYGGTNNRNISSITSVVETYTSDSDISSNLRFATSSSGSASATERMRINSSGYVTMPYQPCFYAMNTTTYTSSGYMICGSVYVNIGSCYNSSNGRFTAPVAGTYSFSFNALKRGGAGRMALYKNGAYYGAGTSQTYSGVTTEIPHAATVIITLAVNDYVQVYLSIDAGDFYGNANSHSGFSGQLIG
jgi:hypothetical protein